jgi:hypothetical protein
MVKHATPICKNAYTTQANRLSADDLLVLLAVGRGGRVRAYVAAPAAAAVQKRHQKVAVEIVTSTNVFVPWRRPGPRPGTNGHTLSGSLARTRVHLVQSGHAIPGHR